MSSVWQFNDADIKDEEIPKKAIGFIYRISHLDGKYYIGRKSLTKVKTTQVKGKKKKSKVESDWKDYWSSSEKLQAWVKEEGEAKFTREILLFVETSSACMYAEEMLLYSTGALFDPTCLNENIRAKVMRKWFMNKETDLHSRLINLPLLRQHTNQE